jgi:tRNA(fMet)-specific endonuclease VapC
MLTAMSGSYLLDTNIVILLFAAEETVLQSISEAEEIFIPSVVLGELYYGAERSSRPAENIAKLDEFAAENTILSCTAMTAQFYGEVKNRLRIVGRPIPENDVWIAALARQHALSLVTRDRHFEAVEAIDLVVW